MENKEINTISNLADIVRHIKRILMLAFDRKVKIDSKIVRREMYSYFKGHDWNYEYSITDIVVYETKNKYFIDITTHMPGMLIGKAGIFLDELQTFLKEELHKEVEIHIIECKLWFNLYR